MPRWFSIGVDDGIAEVSAVFFRYRRQFSISRLYKTSERKDSTANYDYFRK